MLEGVENSKDYLVKIGLSPLEVNESILDSIDSALENYITDSGLFCDRDATIHNLNTFYEKCGKFFAEDAFYEQRMCLFWDLSIFYHNFLSENKVAEEAYVPEELKTVIDHTHYSLFKVKKVRPDYLIVHDEIKLCKLTISARPNQNFTGMHKSDYLQAFLYSKDSLHFLSHGLIIHPCAAKKSIQKFIKKRILTTAPDRLAALCDLSRVHLRHVRHMHVAPERIYSELESL